MTDNVVHLSPRVLTYLEQAIDGFINDPPDSDFQRGFLAALLVVYHEGAGKFDERYINADRLVTQDAPEQAARFIPTIVPTTD